MWDKEGVLPMQARVGHVALCALLAGTGGCSPDSKGSGTETTAVASPFSIDGETAREKAFTEFESGQVRPLALSSDGRLLYATNTPDNRLEIFRVTGFGLRRVASGPVGLEPLAVAERRAREGSVVNHPSDNVSIVGTRVPERAHVPRTLLVRHAPLD